MKSGNNILGFILFIFIGIPIFILFLPIMVVLYPFHLYKRIRFEKKYTEFLYENNGMNFFCYNNRKNSKNYIEKSIIPNLTEQVEIVYLNGKKVESKQKSIFISEALFKLKKYNRFPHLMKIRNGKLIDKSINNPFYNVLNLNKDKTSLLTKINLFFELNEIENGA